jgi:hypothetical protein
MISLIFNIGNIFVLPFWGLMILAPNREITKKVMNSYIPFIFLASLYLFLFLNITITASELTEQLANPQLASIAQAFGDERVAATGWVHFLVMDLFVGRWIYLDGQEKGIFARHSILLALFAGPLGLLSHFTTLWVASQFNKNIDPVSE